MDTENWKFRYFWITSSGMHAVLEDVAAPPLSFITSAVRSTMRCTPVVPTNMWWASSFSMNSQVRASGSKADSLRVPSWYFPSRSVK